MTIYGATRLRWMLHKVGLLRSIVTPQDFGAKGDGVTDDSAAWLETLGAAQRRGCDVYIPAGQYRLDNIPDREAGDGG